jgi:hypothetical protein
MILNDIYFTDFTAHTNNNSLYTLQQHPKNLAAAAACSILSLWPWIGKIQRLLLDLREAD